MHGWHGAADGDLMASIRFWVGFDSVLMLSVLQMEHWQ